MFDSTFVDLFLFPHICFIKVSPSSDVLYPLRSLCPNLPLKYDYYNGGEGGDEFTDFLEVVPKSNEIASQSLRRILVALINGPENDGFFDGVCIN